MAPLKALYENRYRFPIGWFEVGEAALIGIDSILEAMVKVQLICEILKTTQSRQKSYAVLRRRELKFEVGNWLFLKVSPMKVIMRFGKKGKLNPRFVGLYKIVWYIQKVAYELSLPSELVAIHSVSHVSMLKKCIGDLTLVVPLKSIGVKDNFLYEEIPLEILDK
ncbi:uncharacterized protein LOC124892717 [Capsicum annuum]|uniref:uncharacterized protein LOC124892717 n=1 Tax=Capsicum annuum TaxID=4072 RepID=UPI001FB0C999|nr:uncharacterized protein LOC124892717 [Capsicum annuum]